MPQDQETELARMRSEVGALAHEEQGLTERAQMARNQLEALVRRHREMLSDMDKVRLRVVCVVSVCVCGG